MHGYYGLLAPVQSWGSLLTPQAFSFAMSAIRGGYARGSAALQVALCQPISLLLESGVRQRAPRGRKDGKTTIQKEKAKASSRIGSMLDHKISLNF